MPVCEQIVITLPQSVIVNDLEDAKRATKKAQEILKKLTALQKKGRLIGVITHVEALAEQLPSRVEIERTSTGSRIIQSPASRTNLIAAASA